MWFKKYNFSYENKTALFFFTLIIVYFVKFIAIVEYDITIIYWITIALYSVYRVGRRILLINFLLFTVLLFFYATGIFFEGVNWSNSDYEKNIITFIFLSSILMQFIKEEKFEVNYTFSKFEVINISLIYGLIGVWILFLINASTTKGDYVVREYGGANYLTPSDLLAMLTLSIVGLKRLGLISLSVYIAVTAMALFILGSRASIISFVMCCILIVDRKYFAKAVVTGIMYLFILLIVFVMAASIEGEMFSRMKSIFDLADDESRSVRSLFFVEYIENIYQNPECVLLPCQPVPGDYVHNMISIHQYFGLFVFMAFAVSLFMAILKIIKNEYIFAPLFAYVFLQNIFFRSWHSFTFPILISLIICIFLGYGLKLKVKNDKNN